VIFEGRNDILEKFYDFDEKRKLDKDPLLRWCPNAGCGGYGKA
jgi:hypothetical protein